MDMLEARERYGRTIMRPETEAEELVLSTMHELNAADSEEQEAAIAKLNAMGDAYGHVIDGHRHEHEMMRVGMQSAAAAGVGILVAWVSDSRIFPKAAEMAMRMVRGRA